MAEDHSTPGPGLEGRSDVPFFPGPGTAGAGSYVVLIVAMLAADAGLHLARSSAASSAQPGDPLQYPAEPGLVQSHRDPVGLGWRCAAGLSPFRAIVSQVKTLIDALLDIPIVLPPLVIGLSLLILFSKRPRAGPSRR